jgi:hypothetical protein
MLVAVLQWTRTPGIAQLVEVSGVLKSVQDFENDRGDKEACLYRKSCSRHVLIAIGGHAGRFWTAEFDSAQDLLKRAPIGAQVRVHRELLTTAMPVAENAVKAYGFEVNNEIVTTPESAIRHDRFYEIFSMILGAALIIYSIRIYV